MGMTRKEGSSVRVRRREGKLPTPMTARAGNRTLYGKDLWGRVTKVSMPDGGVERYSYDFAGRVSRATDALGNETRFTYRGDGRPESIRRADGTVRRFGYDAEGRCSRLDENGNLVRTVYNMDGRLQESADGMGKVSCRYDRAGRLTRVSSDSGAGAGYRYDRNGRQTQVLYANSMKTSYRYDSRSRMTGMETIMPGGELLYRLSCTYDRAGMEKNW